MPLGPVALSHVCLCTPPQNNAGAENSYNLFTVRKNSDAATGGRAGAGRGRAPGSPAADSPGAGTLSAAARLPATRPRPHGGCAPPPPPDEERSRLEVVGRYHLGEFVNRLAHGSLVMKLPDSGVWWWWWWWCVCVWGGCSAPLLACCCPHPARTPLPARPPRSRAVPPAHCAVRDHQRRDRRDCQPAGTHLCAAGAAAGQRRCPGRRRAAAAHHARRRAP